MGKMTVRLEKVADLVPYARNARTHSAEHVEQIAASIREFGFNAPVLVDGEKGIIAGHGRVLAAESLGMEKVPTIRLDHMTEAQKRAYILADNKLALNAGWDEEVLALELAELNGLGFDVSLIGFSEDELVGLGGVEEDPESDDVEPQIDRAAELQKIWKTKPGQLWSVGNHRLMCGDCRSDEDTARLLGGIAVNIAFTSPPYASQRDYDESSGFTPIKPGDYVDWWEPVQRAVSESLANDGSFFVNIKVACEGLERDVYVLDLVLAMKRRWGWLFAEEFCWERSGIPQQVVRRFKNQFEPVYQFAKGEWKIRPEAVRRESSAVPIAQGKGAGDTNAARRQGRVSAVEGNDVAPGMAYPGNRLPTFSGSHEALGHSAAFPVGLPSFFIKAYSDAGDNVYDPFLGSGTTMVAAEQLGRICHGMEISPAYCAVILQRMADLGLKPKLENAKRKRRGEG